MAAKIILTSDRTLMTDSHHHEFLGFGACMPSNLIPSWLHRLLFIPPIKTVNGKPIAAPYGLRKIEAQLIKDGFDTAIIDPDYLSDYLNDADILGVHTMDPFGLGPASTTFASIFRSEPYLARYFKALMSKTEIKKAKKKGLKIILGGPGVWQFKFRETYIKKFGIDVIVDGEAEKVIGDIIIKLVNGEKVDKYYCVNPSEVPSVDEIPNIVSPAVNGFVELGRGCPRGCKFCSVTLRPLRWYPYEKIVKEIEVNQKVTRNVTLHAEDVMLYGSRNTIPNDEKLLKLHRIVRNKSDNIGWSHCSIAAVAAKPKLFERIGEIIREKQKWWGAEVGIETGSPELAKKIMLAKSHPFKSEQWPEVVIKGMSLMHDNMLIPATTLITGVPEETEDDVMKTLELMDELKNIRSFIVPLFFVPMGKLKNKGWFKENQLTQAMEELLIKCMKHNIRWSNDIMGYSFESGEKWKGKIFKFAFKMFIKIASYRTVKISPLAKI
ncbi:MAG: B12-binding domain-containing radical SAM protein [Candidatus Odinarchaeia archaeon]